MSLFNIITPTYNREHTLDRVYSSLLKQTNQEFNWIIIDDCSSDNTDKLVKRWQDDNKIEIHYRKLEKNQRKAHAVNCGLELCEYKYAIIADSDDSFSEHTLAELKSLWDTIDTTENPEKIASIWTLCKDEDRNIVGDLYPKNFWQVNTKERVLKRSIKGEKWHCWRTSILKEYKLFGDDFCYIFESATWNLINKTYDFLCVNIAHRDYYYSDDGIMATKVPYKTQARSQYYSAFHELKHTSIGDMIKYKHYRGRCFEHIKSSFYIKDRKNKLPFLKRFVASLIFIGYTPFRALRKVI